MHSILPLAASDPAPLSYTIDTVAGSSFVGDGGPAASAALSDAQGVALDGAGNIFIADANDHRIRKITPGGIISTVAGDGFAGFRGDGGPASTARLNTPYGIALDRAGNLYIADLGNNRVRKIGPDGVISTVPGAESLLAPRNVALDAAGVLYISEFGGHRIRRVGADGTVGLIAGNGQGFAGDGGPASAAQFSYPAGLAFDAFGNLYIADSGNHGVRKISGGVITTVLGTGDPGADLPNQLNLPTGVAADNAGNLYIADSGNQRIQELSPGGVIATVPGVGRDLALDAFGNLYIAGGSQVLRLSPSLALSVVAGDGSYEFNGDGASATQARFNAPVALALDAAGAFYVADQKNLRVRAISAAGVVSTIAGDGTAGPGDGQLNFPGGLALDPSGALYISDQNNDRVRMLMLPAGAIATIAGAGVPGFNGDGLPGSATQLFSPGAMTLDSDGALYFADAGNRRLRRISPEGIISTVARLAAGGLTMDAAGNLHASDAAHNRVVRIDAIGRITAIAGTGTAGFGGDGGPASLAQLDGPTGLAADSQGNLFIADTGNNRIRQVGSDGVIRTVAGTGAWDFDGDGGPALAAALKAPTGLAVDASGNVWIADTGNNRIRKLSPQPLVGGQSQEPAVVNAASFLAGPVAPGEIVSIFAQGIGPVTPMGARLDPSGVLTTEIAGSRVLFDGIPAPLFYAQAGQINAQVPYEIAPEDAVEMEVFFQGQSRGRARLLLAAAAPGIFTVDAGSGLAVAINQDRTLNSPIDPAPPGSVITLYATGEGLTQPSGADGKPATAPFPLPKLPATLTVGGYPAEILFAGEAPGFAGLLQINARLPALAPHGALPLLLTIGSATSQSTATLAVR